MSEDAPKPDPADALRARLRAVASAEETRRTSAEMTASEPVVEPFDPFKELRDEAPAKSDGDLWDAPVQRPEESMSSFLVPVIEEPVRVVDRVEPPKLRVPAAAELPKARVVSMPVEPPKDESNKITLTSHIETILKLLEVGELDEAIAQQDTPTFDAPNPEVRARWALTRELIGVAKSLPPRVTSPLAIAIGKDNLASAKGELEAFRRGNPAAAKDADVVLRTRAKAIQRGVAGALYVEPVIQAQPYQSYNPPSITPARSSGANLWWIGVVVVMAIIRIALRTNSHSSYDYNNYDYSYTPSSSYNSQDYEAQLALAEALAKSRTAEIEPVQEAPIVNEEPMKLLRDATPEDLNYEIERSLYVLRESDWVTDDQRLAMSALWVTSPFNEQCTEARTAMKGLEKEPLRAGEGKKISQRHIKAMRARIDRLCPASKKKPAKKAKPTTESTQQIELSDSPPAVEAQ